ncbi:FkbM family methyltransferase [Winogradskyella sp. A3E31]|uniref:FkbM family methyltransferase n=1 Tax=Winogradskyella sp. A3E31 TaxID=3349637 RepID=UPI00398B5D91
MIYFTNSFNLGIRKILKKIGRGYRFYNQKLDVDKVISQNFKVGKSFSFVQVGANDGVSFDNLYEVVTKRKSKGLVIEPLEEYYTQLVENYKVYPEIIPIKKAVHPTASQITIYKVAKSALHKYPDWVKGIASVDPKHHLKINVASEDMEKEEVSCMPLMALIKNSGMLNLDYIQIDTEGFDLEVLKMINFSTVKPVLIKYESVNLSQKDKQEARHLLEKNGYFHYQSHYDSLAIHLGKIKLYWK